MSLSSHRRSRNAGVVEVGLVDEHSIVDLFRSVLTTELPHDFDAEDAGGSGASGRDEFAVDNNLVERLLSTVRSDEIVSARVPARGLARHDVALVGEDHARCSTNGGDELAGFEMRFDECNNVRVVGQIGCSRVTTGDENEVEELAFNRVQEGVARHLHIGIKGNLGCRSATGGSCDLNLRAQHEVDRDNGLTGFSASGD